MDIRGRHPLGDSLSKKIIARGYVTSQPGQRAYRYNDRKPITEPSNPRIGWRHDVSVAWDDDFEPFRYKDERQESRSCISTPPGQTTLMNRRNRLSFSNRKSLKKKRSPEKVDKQRKPEPLGETFLDCTLRCQIGFECG